MDKKKMIRKIVGGSIFMLLLMGAVFVTSKDAYAAKDVKLSKASLTFASDKAKAQTVTIKNLKTSKVKKMTVMNDWKDWFTIKKKGKNKLVVTPKRSGKIYYGSMGVMINYKKPVNGKWTEYIYFKKINVKGSSTIAIKSASDLNKIRPSSYKEWKWKYYLANDIDLTGKGLVNNPNVADGVFFDGIYLDGKGKTIKSDTPIFETVGGTVKNIVFDVNMKCKISKNDDICKIWEWYNVYNNVGIAPIMENDGKLIHCKATGSITIDYDKEFEPYLHGHQSRTSLSEMLVGGLVSLNNNSAEIIQCKSDVDITVNFSTTSHPFAYIGGFVGENYGYKECGQFATISESLYSGKIKFGENNSAYVGGMCGNGIGGSKIVDCLNTGSIEMENYACSAGIHGTGTGFIVERVLTVGSANYGMLGNYISDNNLTDGGIGSYKYAYYLKSKYDAFRYLGEPFEVPGVTAVDDANLTNQSFFSGFDFTSVWEMGAGGPKLRNVPA